MESVDTIVINNEEYLIIDEIIINEVKYIYLALESDPKNFLIRKINIINGNECIVNLDTESEFNDAMLKFYQKNHN